MPNRWRQLFEPVPDAVGDDEPPLLRLVAALHLFRSDLAEAFPLETREGRLGLLRWALTLGVEQYAGLRACFADPSVAAMLLAPSGASVLVGRARVPLPRVLLAFDPSYPDASGTAGEPSGLLHWYVTEGHRSLPFGPGVPAWLHELFFDGGPEHPRPRESWLVLLLLNRADLVAAIRRRGGDFGDDARAWLASEEGESIEVPPMWIERAPEPPRARGDLRGVNLVGHLDAELGLGEDSRCASAALTAAGVPHVLIDQPAGPNVSTAAHSFAAPRQATPHYAVNLLCLTGQETLRFFFERGPGLFEDRYTIGLWPWELPRWPERLAVCACLVDEIWAISRFVQDAFSLPLSVPVVWMPPAVVLQGTPTSRRRDFGLPEDAYIVLTAGDTLSSLARKNPRAAIAAFRRAFAPEDLSVRLVVKIMRRDAHASAWNDLTAAAAGDPRILFLDRTLTRRDVLDLIASCDCLLSLHRAEGFGRVLAEALVLKKAVVSTNWSGNVDFADEDGHFLVDHRLVEVRPGEYPFGAGSVWAEPDLEAAVEALRHAHVTPPPGRAPARFAPDVVGARYAERLATIAAFLDRAARPLPPS